MSFRAEVFSVVVAEVVVADNGDWFDTCVDEEVCERGFEFGLTGFEVITDYVLAEASRELDDTRNKGVLWGAINETASLKKSRHSVNRTSRDIRITFLYTRLQVLPGIILSLDQITEALSVSGPHHDHLITGVFLFEVSDVFSDLEHMCPFVISWEGVICSVFLVGGDEVGVVDSFEGLHFFHVGAELALEVVVDYLGTGHGVCEVEVGDVPAAEYHCLGINHWHDFIQCEKDFFTAVKSNLRGRCLRDRPIEIWNVLALLGVPGDVVSVGKYSRGHG